MANLRPVLLVSLVFLGYLLWVEWQKDYGAKPPPQPATTASSETAPAPEIPAAAETPSQASGDLPEQLSPLEEPTHAAEEAQAPATRNTVKVFTDVLTLEIDPVGATVVSARLNDYPVTLENPQDTVRLFTPSGPDFYIAQSGLLSRQPAPNHTSEYQSARAEYRLGEGADTLEVPFTWSGADGVQVTKTFVLHRGSYVIQVRTELGNHGEQAWTGALYSQLQRAVHEQPKSNRYSNPSRYSFNGIGFYSPEEKLEKVKYKNVAEEPYQRTDSGGWLAMIQHYFFAAWIPPADESVTYTTQVYTPAGRPQYIARGVTPQVQVEPGASHDFDMRLYVGPKLQDTLDKIAPGLDLTVNYGIFTVISAPLFWLLEHIHGLVGNWGWAIVLLTVLVKLAFFKLTEAQYRSMARMRKLQPRIEKLRERYGDDRQRMSQAMMELYREERVNPLGGCLPIVVQIPVFIALYWVLLESVELRQAPFILWINNLSVRDPYFILPALNATFMIATQRLTPTVGMDPLQRRIMQAMPLVFAVMFAFFPAGLVLYWATNAGLSLAQQWYITRRNN